jgi:hypothetical protein
LQKQETDNDTTFEERIVLSSIICKHEIPSSMPPLVEFSQDFQILIRESKKSTVFNVAMDLTTLHTLSEHEQNLASLLLFTLNRIRKDAKILPYALSKKFNYEKNNQLNFLVKNLALLLEGIVCNSKLNSDWDVTSINVNEQYSCLIFGFVAREIWNRCHY